MKIKQIELNGFKSFADRSLFSLHSGVTCIVGPNGCGKSNIVDSFRWVLGEQSAKSLRGEKMEEVIFQGSASKKQKGMAEVTLVLSMAGLPRKKAAEGNGNGGTSADDSAQDEIIVSRRLYRSGESEYLLNKRQCRLKDIRDIFLDTGLDVKSYSILDQGKITEIINTKPLDRRYLIEEVAGVMKYKVRKAEALSKLESSKQNLQRINDIVYEIKRQINSLDRQVKKAERYKRLIDEAKAVELRLLKREHSELSGILNVILRDIERLRETDSLKRGELSELENRLELKRLELVDKEKALAELENSLHEKERSLSDSETQIAVLKTNIENRKAEISRLISLRAEMDIKKEELSKKLSEIDDTEKSLSSSLEDISAELDEKKASTSAIEADISGRELEIENRRKDLFRISDALSNKNNEFHKLRSSQETLEFKESHAVREMEVTRTGITELEKALAEIEEFIKERTEEHSGLVSERDSLTEKIAQLRDDIEKAKTGLSSERETLASNLSRLSSLRELIVDRSLADFFSQAADTARPPMTVLSDIISADKQYEKVIEAALADKVNSLMIDKLEDIISTLDIVRDKNLGRTAILYTGYKNPDNINPAFHEDGLSQLLTLSEGREPALHRASLIGRASDFISFENEEARGIASRVLGNTFIVKDLQAAVEFRESRLFAGSTLVTLDGDVIDRDGVIFAGQGKEILKRKREIKELQKITDEQQSLITGIEKDLNSAAESMAAKKESLKNIENSIVEIEKKLSLSNQSLQTQKEELERKLRKISSLEAELLAVSQEKESLKTLLSSKTEEMGLLENELKSVGSEIEAMQQAVGATKSEYEEARSQLMEMKMTLTSYREKMDALQKERAGIIDALSELEVKKELSVREISAAEQKITESLAEQERLEEGIKAVVSEVDLLRQDRAKRKEIMENESEGLVSEGNSLKNLRSEIDSLSQELSGANSKSVENRLKKENIENSVSQKYGLEIAKEDIHTEEFEPREDEEKFGQLNEKIRELGPVNLGTIEEYDELKNRYDFLTKQQQDLTMSIAELEEAISRINTSTRRKLREAYDALRAKFVEVFTMLFGGGRADLVLLDEENILESGLDVVAQPPGKKLQNLNLLSGGEKALTSLALLFAGFLIKPSPLCVLDEVDAPLDESNTVRFANMIKELSSETQFIVITHNRATMEVSDHLYGITMEEPGVSKAISLQFAEVENIG